MKSVSWIGRSLALLALSALAAQAQERFAASGLVLKVDAAHDQIVVSCQAIPGHMDAMVMPFRVHDPKTLEGLKPGMKIDFQMVAGAQPAYAEEIRVHPFESLELDPTQARRLKLMEKITVPKSNSDPLTPGQVVPNFKLTSQSRQTVTLSQFAGKVVALTFIYTRCPLPEYCFRLSNNFGLLQKRFGKRLGADVVLVSVVVDPAHDQPEALANYARIWKANSGAWYFLTGSQAEIERLAHHFDMDFYPEEALYVHSFHTVVIDRHGRLVANLEGNDFTAQQLGDLVETVLANPR